MVSRILIPAVIWCSLSTQSIASQEIISGSNLADLVTQRLTKEGLSANPIININRIFYGCGSDNIIISKRDKSWKTVKLTCRNNKLWSYSFRNKITESATIEKFEDLQKAPKHSTPKKTKKVFSAHYIYFGQTVFFFRSNNFFLFQPYVIENSNAPTLLEAVYNDDVFTS